MYRALDDTHETKFATNANAYRKGPPSNAIFLGVFWRFGHGAEGAIPTLFCSAVFLQHIGEEIYTLIGLPGEVSVEQTVVGPVLVEEKFVVVRATVPTKS
jgi:hypothetical protein